MIQTFFYQEFVYQSGTFNGSRSVNSKARLDIDVSRNTSFLIPEVYFRRFFKGKKNLNAVIKHLLEESSSTLFFGCKPDVKHTIAKEYQAKGLSLRKVTCRVEESLLIELESLARYFQISRCKLISVMLRLKRLGWLKLVRKHGIVRDTTRPEKLTISLHIYPRDRPRPTFSNEILEIPYDS
jgi:hypothetical protein